MARAKSARRGEPILQPMQPTMARRNIQEITWYIQPRRFRKDQFPIQMCENRTTFATLSQSSFPSASTDVLTELPESTVSGSPVMEPVHRKLYKYQTIPTLAPRSTSTASRK